MPDDFLKNMKLDYLGFTYTEDEIEAMELAYKIEEQNLKSEVEKLKMSAIEQVHKDYEGASKNTYQLELFDHITK